VRKSRKKPANDENVTVNLLSHISKMSVHASRTNMKHINLPYQQAVGNSAVHTSKLNSLQNQLLQLWALHGGESNSAQLIMMENRAAKVLREVSRCSSSCTPPLAQVQGIVECCCRN